MDCQRLTVQTMSFVHEKGPVFFASLSCRPCVAETSKECATVGAMDKRRLVISLWDHLAAMESPVWKRWQSSDREAFPIRVVCGLLGRPRLMLGEYPGPAISFSKGGGKVWAALSGDESDIGIDVAGTDEFQSGYPFQRVFSSQEIQHALRLTGGNVGKASALLWSIKEAVVKALGCAFHLVDPRQIIVYPPAAGVVTGKGGHTFPVGLSGKALERFPMAAGRSLWVHSFPQRNNWLSIALLKRRPIGHV